MREHEPPASTREEEQPATRAIPAVGRAATVMQLQRQVGNRAVGRLLQRRGTNVLPFDEDIFKSKIGAAAAATGQMVWDANMRPQLIDKLKKEVFDKPWSDGDTLAKAKQAFSDHMYLVGDLKWDAAKAKLAEIRKLLGASSDPMAAVALSFVGDDAEATLHGGGKTTNELWARYAKGGNKLPDLGPFLTLAKFQGVKRWDMQACKDAAKRVSTLFVKGGGFGGSRSPATHFTETFLSAGVQGWEKSKDLGDNVMTGNVVRYGGNLSEMVDKMRRALDDGWLVHARVLSGTWGTTPEHSIVVFGHEDPNAFMFFDPDVAGSDIGRTGFGRVYHDKDANRLSTAKSEADLGAYDMADPDDPSKQYSDPTKKYGYSRGGVHRYQVMSVECL